MLLPLDGPSLQSTLSVTSSTVLEVKIGSVPLEERKVVTLQPINGRIYVYFGDGGVAPSSATVISDGLELYRRSKESFEASASQSIYILAFSGTVNVKIVERA